MKDRAGLPSHSSFDFVEPESLALGHCPVPSGAFSTMSSCYKPDANHTLLPDVTMENVHK